MIMFVYDSVMISDVWSWFCPDSRMWLIWLQFVHNTLVCTVHTVLKYHLEKKWLCHSRSSTTPLPHVNMVISTPFHRFFFWLPRKKTLFSHSSYWRLCNQPRITNSSLQHSLSAPWIVNIRSPLNSLYIIYATLRFLILRKTRCINIFALTGTWIIQSTNLAKLAEATPPDFTLCSRFRTEV